GGLRAPLADRGAVQRAGPGLGAGRLPDAAEGRDRPPPARLRRRASPSLLPGPSAADPPVHRATRCTSQEDQRASRDAADEPTPRGAAEPDRQGTDPQTCERTGACETTKETL